MRLISETAMAQIEAALGMETGTLSGAGIQVQSGATVTIPSDLVQVDTSGIEAAVEQSAASGSEDTTVEKQVNVTTTAGSTDTTPVEQAAQAALSGETSTTDTTMTTNLTVEAGSTDATPAATSAQAELDNTFSNTMQTNGSTDVTIEKASDNIAAVYSQVGSELQAALTPPYSARASVNVTVDYHITNPKCFTEHAQQRINGFRIHCRTRERWRGGSAWRRIILVRRRGQRVCYPDGTGQTRPRHCVVAAGRRGPGRAGQQRRNCSSRKRRNCRTWRRRTGQQYHFTVAGTAAGRKQERVERNRPGNVGDSSEEESEGKKAVSVNAAVQGQQGNNNFEINVDMSPVIKIEGGNMDEEKVFEVMKNRIREMADDLGDEIAERMSKDFCKHAACTGGIGIWIFT